jgi:hypothetical protein
MGRQVVLLSLAGLLLAVSAASQRQIVVDKTNSTTLPRKLKLGTSDEGYAGEIDLYKYQDERFLEYWIEITATGSPTTIEESGLLFMNRLEIELDDRKLDLEAIADRAAMRRAVLSQPVGLEEPPAHSFGPASPPQPPPKQVMAVEQKSFAISRDDFLGIAESGAMTLRVSGSTGRDSRWTLKPKKLEKLSDWVRKNV